MHFSLKALGASSIALVTSLGFSPSTFAIETLRSCSVALNNDQYVVLSGFQGSVLDVLSNDSGELDRDSLVTVGQTTAAGGTVFVVDGAITYSPPPNFSGEDSFSYQVSEKDWRADNVNVPVRLSDAGAAPAITTTGISVIAAPSIGSESDWTAGNGLTGEVLFGRQISLDADFTGCYQDSDPQFSVQLQWLLTKRSGATNPADQFEASISPLANHPTAAFASQAFAWPASSSRQLLLNIDDLAGSQLHLFRAGLFAQAHDSFGSYQWSSSGVQASASISTSHCLLCTREARVTITVDTDTDGDGVSDSADVDDDNDGIPDLIEGRIDSDSDGIPNHQDLDSDNDGVPDLVEVGGGSNSVNGRVTGGQDANGDGWNDLAQTSLQPERDVDGDGVLSFLDLDSDNDGTSDLEEQGLSDQFPRDGRIDGFRDANADGVHDLNVNNTLLLDTDEDGEANLFDLDTDNDGGFDTAENALQDYDLDLDGTLDAMEDGNNNGIVDVADANLTGGADLNQNGVDDAFDARVQLGGDQDSDGITDNSDPDANGDGWLDSAALFSLVDANNDGTHDYKQASFNASSIADTPLSVEPDLALDNGVSASAGLSGFGGCALNPSAKFDPILIMMSLISILYLLIRRLQTRRVSST